MSTMKHSLKLSAEALACFLVVCWSGALSYQEALWLESVTFFGLAMYEGYRYRTELPTVYIALSLIIGRIIAEIPIRISEWDGSIGSLPITISCVIAICLGCLCAKKEFRFWYLLLSLVLFYATNLVMFNNVFEMLTGMNH